MLKSADAHWESIQNIYIIHFVFKSIGKANTLSEVTEWALPLDSGWGPASVPLTSPGEAFD